MAVCTTKGRPVFDGSPARSLSFVVSVAAIRVRGIQFQKVKEKLERPSVISSITHLSSISNLSSFAR